jgi:hypothetical protein
MKIIITVLFVLLITLAPVYSIIQPFDLINNVVNLKVLSPNTIQISGNTLTLSRPITIPNGNYLYIRYFGFDYDLVGAWSRKIVNVGSRALVYLFIANTFYDILNRYLEAVNEYNSIYEAFVSCNPGMGQGSFLVLNDLFNPFLWHFAVQGKSVEFNNVTGKNEVVNVYEDTSNFNSYGWLTGVFVGRPWSVYMWVNFTSEYMNTLTARYAGYWQEGLYIIHNSYVLEKFGTYTHTAGWSYAAVGVTVGVMANPYLDAYLEGVRAIDGAVDITGYLEGVLEAVNELALRRDFVLEGTPGILIIGYVFPAVETVDGLVIPEGMVIPVGANATFEQDIELVSEGSPAIVDVQVENPPAVEDEVDRDKNNWLIILQDLQNKFPFSIPYTYSYLFTFVTSYSYSDLYIVNDIELKINNLLRSAFGSNITVNLDPLTPLVTMMRTFGTLTIIFLLVVGYRRLLM